MIDAPQTEKGEYVAADRGFGVSRDRKSAMRKYLLI